MFLVFIVFKAFDMVATQKSITYFNTSGPKNTDETLRLARERADELGVKEVIVASTRGETGVKASEIFKGFNLVVVSHAAGWREAGKQEIRDEDRVRIEKNGGKILTCPHVFAIKLPSFQVLKCPSFPKLQKLSNFFF